MQTCPECLKICWKRGDKNANFTYFYTCLPLIENWLTFFKANYCTAFSCLILCSGLNCSCKQKQNIKWIQRGNYHQRHLQFIFFLVRSWKQKASKRNLFLNQYSNIIYLINTYYTPNMYQGLLIPQWMKNLSLFKNTSWLLLIVWLQDSGRRR